MLKKRWARGGGGLGLRPPLIVKLPVEKGSKVSNTVPINSPSPKVWPLQEGFRVVRPSSSLRCGHSLKMLNSSF